MYAKRRRARFQPGEAPEVSPYKTLHGAGGQQRRSRALRETTTQDKSNSTDSKGKKRSKRKKQKKGTKEEKKRKENNDNGQEGNGRRLNAEP